MTTESKFTESLSAYDLIKKSITENKITLGQSVTEKELSDRFHIGRTPIREALKRLEQEGLIITENRRKRVYTLGIKEVTELFELKISIESYLCQLAADRAQKDQLKRIEQSMDKLELLSQKLTQNASNDLREFQKWLVADEQLHRHIYEAAGNQMAIETINRLNIKWHRFKMGMSTLQGRLAISAAEHRKFVDAILIRNGKKASKLMIDHLENVLSEIKKIMSIAANQPWQP